VTGRASGLVKKIGCWFVDVNNFTGVLHVLQLQLPPPPLSSLPPIKSRIETFCYWLTGKIAIKMESSSTVAVSMDSSEI